MQCIFKNYLSPVYTTLDFWYSSDKNGMCTNFTHVRTTYLQGQSTGEIGTGGTFIPAVPKIKCSVNRAYRYFIVVLPSKQLHQTHS